VDDTVYRMVYVGVSRAKRLYSRLDGKEMTPDADPKKKISAINEE